MAARKRRASSKPAMPPRRFFDVAAPRILAALRAPCAELGGRYVVEVEGEDGGAWTLDYPRAEVRPGAEPGVDLSVRLSAEDLGAVLAGKEELAKLVADGRARAGGDRARIESLSLVTAFLQRG